MVDFFNKLFSGSDNSSSFIFLIIFFFSILFLYLFFDKVSNDCSEITTKQYSTSFSLGIKILDKSLHNPIYGIYGFVRLADEIVDSFHNYNNKQSLPNL